MFAAIMSPYVIVIIIAWLVAHLIKLIISLIKNEKFAWFNVFASGGMPSSHTATAVALMTVIGFRDNFGSGLFGLSLLFTIIVAYDAMKVRRSSGEQGLAVHSIIKEQKSNIKLPRISMGHTPLEVVAGVFLGVIIGLVVFLSTK